MLMRNVTTSAFAITLIIGHSGADNLHRNVTSTLSTIDRDFSALHSELAALELEIVDLEDKIVFTDIRYKMASAANDVTVANDLKREVIELLGRHKELQKPLRAHWEQLSELSEHRSIVINLQNWKELEKYFRNAFNQYAIPERPYWVLGKWEPAEEGDSIEFHYDGTTTRAGQPGPIWTGDGLIFLDEDGVFESLHRTGESAFVWHRKGEALTYRKPVD